MNINRQNKKQLYRVYFYERARITYENIRHPDGARHIGVQGGIVPKWIRTLDMLGLKTNELYEGELSKFSV